MTHSRSNVNTSHATDDEDEEEDEGRGLLQASAANKVADSSAAQRRSKPAAAPSAASSSVAHRSSVAAPADIALESHHHSSIHIAPSPLRRVQPILPARPFNPLEHERNQRKRWYWMILLSAGAVIVSLESCVATSVRAAGLVLLALTDYLPLRCLLLCFSDPRCS